MFGKKLKCLMDMTKTTNTELSVSIPVSQACISRLKNGKRKPPKTAGYISNMSDFFAKKIVKNNLKNKLNEIIKIDEQKSLKCNIETWLKSNDQIPKLNDDFELVVDNNYYYGDEGKRKAVIRFLSNASQKTDKTLLLYSDESMSWMMDKDFAIEWKTLLIKVLKNRNKIKIIHTIAREYSEIFDAVSKWIPMYLTGLIEPYYFPKLRDGIERRTLFISSNEAIISNSVGNNTESMLNIYINDSKALSSLKKEYNNYLSLCKPLLNIYTECNEEKTLNLYGESKGNIIVDSYSLSFISAPNNLIIELLNKKGLGYLKDNYLSRKQLLLDNLDNNFILDIVNVSNNFTDNIPYCFINNLFYTKDNYLKHLKNILNMLISYDNYNVMLKSDKLSSSSIFIKEDTELIIEKNDNTSVLLSNEFNIIKAFWEYYILNKNNDKNRTISILKDIINEIERTK